MGEFDTSFSCSTLLYEETEEACLSETGREYHGSINSNVDSENEDEFIEKLLQREIDAGFKANASFSGCLTISKSWLESARLDAIEWIFNKRGTFGFQIRTAYLSVIYFDQFLSKRSIDDGKLWAIRLLSIACLLLAAKMEEYKAPALSEFSVEDYQFENKAIQRMELLVLSTLEWKMNSITPFVYLHYFITKFYGESKLDGLNSKAQELIMAFMKETSFLHHRPSFIAAAAVLAASNCRLTRKAMELKINFISLWQSLDIEQIFSCYNMMQEIEMRKSKTPEFVISSNYSSTDHNSVYASSAISTGTGNKRKLIFNESDQTSLAKESCRS